MVKEKKSTIIIMLMHNFSTAIHITHFYAFLIITLENANSFHIKQFTIFKIERKL